MNSLSWKLGGKSSVFQSYSFVVLQLPLHALVLFGCYALCNIGYNLMTLGKYNCGINYCFVLTEDCDAAHLEVVAQIDEAKAGLKKRGYKLKLAESQ